MTVLNTIGTDDLDGNYSSFILSTRVLILNAHSSTVSEVKQIVRFVRFLRGQRYSNNNVFCAQLCTNNLIHERFKGITTYETESILEPHFWNAYFEPLVSFPVRLGLRYVRLRLGKVRLGLGKDRIG